MFLQIHKKIVDIFSSRSPASVFGVSLILLVLLGSLDHATGDYSLIVFYLIPVSLVAWFVSRTSGVLFCLLAFITRFLADLTPGSFLFNNSELHYWNISVEFLFLLIMSLLFSALRRNLDSEKGKASTDPLTGALNRRSFFEIAEYEINWWRRYSQPFTIAYIDLDNFKEINDHLGHHTGDELLVAVVTTIMGSIRSTDILARFGGDEFVLLLPDTGSDAALTFLTKIHDHLQQTMTSNKWPVGFSIGAVTYLKTPATVDEAICQADTLMYEVKRSGKNRLLHIEATEATNGQREF
jgi:diguanylate cyclase (GGDEF)-like protein